MTDQTSPAGTADDFFDGVGGSGAPSFKFGGVGTGIKGTVVDQYRTVVTQPDGTKKLYDDGREIPQLNVTLQTDLRNWDKVTKIPEDENKQPKPASEDTGLRRIYIKFDMRRAVGAALQAAQVRSLATGGTLAVKKSGERPTGKGNPLPLYEARYQAPVASDGFDFGAESTPAPPSAPAAPAPVVDDEPPF